jgi:alpha-L-fucosidase
MKIFNVAKQRLMMNISGSVKIAGNHKTYITLKLSHIIFCLLVFISCAFSQEKSNYLPIAPGDSRETIIRKAANVIPSERQLRWQKLEMTVFFHFGINTFTDKEWGDGTEDPVLFDPEDLDAEQWIRTVKDAGFKQVILTAKHHDGFCLWPSATTEHSVKNSPWKNGKGDVVKEVAMACKKYNIGFGVYLSPWDRNAKCYGTDAYNDFFVKQLTELLTQYGVIDEVWFDGANGEGPNGKKQEYDFMRWYRLIREKQPKAVIAIMGPDVRWVGTESGMGRETEWSVIPVMSMEAWRRGGGDFITGQSTEDLIYKPLGNLMEPDLGSREKLSNARGLLWYPAETDVSIRPGWFYHEAEDSLVKTPQQLMDIYFTSVGMNSVLLLNIPPDKSGLISEHDRQSLEGFKQIYDKAFQENLARNAVLSCENGINTPDILDSNSDTYFTTEDADTATIIQIDLVENKAFNVVCLQENIAIGQRVENFELEYLDKDGNWVPAASGTTIGYKRLIKTGLITARKLRLKIVSSRSNPAISEFGIYFLQYSL